MVNASLRTGTESGAPLPPTLLSAQSESEVARLLAISAVENYKLSMRLHHEPMSNGAKVLVSRAKEDAARVLELEGRTATLKLA